MPHSINALVCDSEGNSAPFEEVTIDRLPNECPRCHVTIEPILIGNAFTQAFAWLEVYFRCSNRKCQHHMIATYVFDSERSRGPSGPAFNLAGTIPYKPVERNFSEPITTLSPSFATIFNQASAAEGYQLPDVAGPGYRKALEFLLKDYAIKLHPNDAPTIRKMQLANVISTYFNEPRMSVVFSRATWLGNDETHYERRWVDHDITNLKTLIVASVHFIEMEVLVSTLPAEMPHPNQAK
jgi:hypothetical protein